MLFEVMVSGEGIRLCLEEESSVDAGFVKNEIVMATSPRRAKELAFKNIRARLKDQAEQGGVIIEALEMHVDEVQPTFKIWKLIMPDGFVFFPKGNHLSHH